MRIKKVLENRLRPEQQMHQEAMSRAEGNDMKDSSQSGTISRHQLQGQGFIDGEETLNILDELRDEILKESREQIAEEFEQLIQDFEDRNIDARQREFLDYILDNMAGADLIQGLPDLVKQSQQTQEQID